MNLNNQSVKPVHVPPTRFDRILDFAALFLLILLWTVAIGFYIDAPEKVPTGFDAAGNPRGWGSPAFYFLMPGIGVLYAAAIFATSYFPQLINLPVTLKKETVGIQSALMIRCGRWLNIVGLAMFLHILLFTGSFQHEAVRMDASTFVIGIYGSIFLMIAVIIYYSVRIMRVK